MFKTHVRGYTCCCCCWGAKHLRPSRYVVRLREAQFTIYSRANGHSLCCVQAAGRDCYILEGRAGQPAAATTTDSFGRVCALFNKYARMPDLVLKLWGLEQAEQSQVAAAAGGSGASEPAAVSGSGMVSETKEGLAAQATSGSPHAEGASGSSSSSVLLPCVGSNIKTGHSSSRMRAGGVNAEHDRGNRYQGFRPVLASMEEVMDMRSSGGAVDVGNGLYYNGPKVLKALAKSEPYKKARKHIELLVSVGVAVVWAYV